MGVVSVFRRPPVLPGTGDSLRSVGYSAAVGLLLAGAVAAPSAAPPAKEIRAPRTGPGGAVLAPAETLRVVDDEGGVVALPSPARRIVSLVPALTETLFAIGAGERLAGRTRFDRHPPEVRAVPEVGDGIRPSIEAVRAQDPDLVVLFAGPDNRGVREELDRLGLSTLAVRHNTLGDLRRNVGRLGRLTGCGAEAEALLRRIEAGLDRVRTATEGLAPPRVYYDVWPTPPITVGAGSYLDTLLTIAGARNVFGDLGAASPRVSLEAIAARDPELILWPRGAGSANAASPPTRRPGWRALRAVRAGAVRAVDADLVHRLGPRVGEAAAELARAVHPETAAALDPAAWEEAAPDAAPCRIEA